MKNFQEILEKWRKLLISQGKPAAYCDKIAEIRAFIEVTIPDGYRHFTIDDLNGKVKSKQVVTPKSLLEIRETLIQYCWGKEMVEKISSNGYELEECIKYSVMDGRRKNGTNLVVYGDSWVGEQIEGKKAEQVRKIIKLPTGKTLIGALVLKEAIYNRLFPHHAADSYVWEDHPTMMHRLMSHNAKKSTNEFDEQVDSYTECDWLVVDDISISEGETEAQRAFKANVLDTVFLERINRGLPSILLFQNDISRIGDLQHYFGVAVNRIVSNSKTFKIKIELEK